MTSYTQHFFDAPNLEGPEGTHRIAWLEWGDTSNQDILFCVHGLTRNAHDFDFLARALSTEYRIIAPDMPGRGDSEWLSHTANYNYVSYMMDCLALLEHLAVGHAHWIGTSMGGIIGMMVAVLHPGILTSLTLNDIGARVPREGLQRIVAYVSQTPASFASRAEAETRLREVVATFGLTTQQQWEHLFRYSIKESPDGQFRFAFDPNILEPVRQQTENFTQIEDIDLTEFWQAVTIPCLLIRGGDSDILTQAIADEMLAANPQSVLKTFPGIGHAPTLMEDNQITVIREWLKSH